jgi:replicative DNA helicase
MNETEYEYEIICMLICNPQCINECELESKHFSNDFYKKIYPLIEKQYKEKGIIDFYEIENKFSGFYSFALECIEHYVTSANLHYYIEKVENNYKLRKYNEIIDKCNNGYIDFEEMQNELDSVKNEFIKTGDKNKLSEEEIYRVITKENEMLEFDNFKQLENNISFIKNGIHVISARTSVGKSALAINLMNDLSKKYKCIYLNMEMNEQKIYQRMIACESNIPISNFTNLSETQSNTIKRTIKNIHNRNWKIMNGSKSVRGIKSIIARESRDEHLILFVDYIGYVTTGKKQNDRERIGEAVREIQLMTKDYDVTVFLLAQINRDGNDEPTLVNLKDSGEIEQSAETVLILHNTCKDLNEEQPIYSILVPKNRNGKQGKLEIKFNKPCQKFEEIVEGYGYGNRVY